MKNAASLAAFFCVLGTNGAASLSGRWLLVRLNPISARYPAMLGGADKQHQQKGKENE